VPRRTVSLKERERAVLLKQFQEFRDKFGREPKPGDPVFFDPECDTNRGWYLTRSRWPHLWSLKRHLERSRSLPRFCYAFRKTHRLVTAESRDNLLSDELQEWEDAIDEYKSRIEDESDSVEICFAPPNRFREPPPHTAEIRVADKLCLLTLFAYEKGTSTFALEGTFFNAWLSLICMRKHRRPSP